MSKCISPSYGLGTTPGCSVLIARSALQVHFYKLTSKPDAGIVIKRLSTITFVINGQLIEAPAEAICGSEEGQILFHQFKLRREDRTLQFWIFAGPRN